MSYTFSLGRVPGEAAALIGIVAGPEIASRTRAAGMSNKQVASFASSPGSFRALMNPNLPVNNLVTPSVEIFDQPASNFTDVTRQVKDAIRAKRTAPPTRPPSSLTSPLLKSQAVVQQPEPQHKVEDSNPGRPRDTRAERGRTRPGGVGFGRGRRPLGAGARRV